MAVLVLCRFSLLSSHRTLEEHRPFQPTSLQPHSQGRRAHRPVFPRRHGALRRDRLFRRRLGVTSISAHTIAGNINWATFVLPMSLGTAAGIRIGLHVGAVQYDRAMTVARMAFAVSLGYTVVVSVLLVLLRHDVVSIYTDDEAVRTLAASLLLLVAIYQIFDDTKARWPARCAATRTRERQWSTRCSAIGPSPCPLAWCWDSACGNCRR